MAGIDKIYGTNEQYRQLFNWCKRYASSDYLDRFYPEDGYEDPNDRPIANFRLKQDRWLWGFCPIRFVCERLKEQYGETGPKRDRMKSPWRYRPKRHPHHNIRTWGFFTGTRNNR